MPELPEQAMLALADIAGAAREGLLAMSVAAGMAVIQAMLEAEVAEVAGPKGRHDPDRVAVRHGVGRGSVTLGGRRVPVSRPRPRTIDGHEVPLAPYAGFAADDASSAPAAEDAYDSPGSAPWNRLIDTGWATLRTAEHC
ncbi:MAG: family transposase [Marmoricola sp.]|nr:family transposase [Marmoricola sp.]